MSGDRPSLDALDLDLITALTDHPRAGVLELSRLLHVARGTVQARLRRLEAAGVITGYGPDVDLRAAGYPVQAFVTTGVGDVLCRIAAPSHEDLQQMLLLLNRSRYVVRSTSVIALSVVVPYRVLPLLRAEPLVGPRRAPAYRRHPAGGALTDEQDVDQRGPAARQSAGRTD
jgi:DNA-binding Lrp family transcriptional regulator